MSDSFVAMFGSFSLVILVLAFAAVILLTLLTRQQKSKKDLPIWLFASIAGIFLGVGASAAIASFAGYGLVKVKPGTEEFVTTPSGTGGPGAGGATAPASDGVQRPGGMGGGGGMMGGGGMGGGGMGGGMGGGGGRGGPSSRRDLTTLVRKLNLLTGDIAVELSDEQEKKVAEALAEVEKAEAMSDEDAKKKHEELLAVLSDDQKANLDEIGLPFRPRGGGPGGGGPGGGFGGGGPGAGGPGGPGGGGPGGGGPGGGPGGPGGGGPGGGNAGADDANPFAQEDNLKALEQLREKLEPSAP